MVVGLGKWWKMAFCGGLKIGLKSWSLPRSGSMLKWIVCNECKPVFSRGEDSSACSCWCLAYGQWRPVTPFAQTKPKLLDYFLADWFLFFWVCTPCDPVFLMNSPAIILHMLHRFTLPSHHPSVNLLRFHHFQQDLPQCIARPLQGCQQGIQLLTSQGWFQLQGTRVPVHLRLRNKGASHGMLTQHESKVWNGKTEWNIWSCPATTCHILFKKRRCTVSMDEFACWMLLALLPRSPEIERSILKWTDNNASFVAFHVLISVSCQILIFEHVPGRHSAPYAVDAKLPKQTRNQALSTTAVTKIPWGTKCSTVCAAINNNANRTSESMIPAMQTLLFKCFLQMIIAANICRIKMDIV